MYDFLVWLGQVYQFQRAFTDAGGYFLQMDQEQRQEYMEAFLMSKRLL